VHEDHERRTSFDAIADAIERAGGSIERRYVTALVGARA